MSTESCNCLCFANHIGAAVCDPDAPAALVHVDASNSMLAAATGVAERVVQMCLSCADAFQQQNPRWMSTAVLR